MEEVIDTDGDDYENEVSYVSTVNMPISSVTSAVTVKPSPAQAIIHDIQNGHASAGENWLSVFVTKR